MNIKLLNSFLTLAIALFTASCGPDKSKAAANSDQPPADQELQQAPDEMLSGFSVSGYGKGGKKQWDLEGKSADIQTEEIKLTDVTSKVYGKDMNLTIVADQGSLNRVDNNVHLENNVVATTEDGATVACDYLDWDSGGQKLSSDSPVQIKRGMMEAKGTGLIGQPALNYVELKKDVTVKISPPAQEESEPLAREDSLPQPPASSILENIAAKPQAPPTIITCSGPLEVAYAKNLAIFQGDVKVSDSRGEIIADRMEVYFTTKAQGQSQIQGMEGMGIEKVVATGDVEIHRAGNVTFSQEAVYDTNSGKLTLTGQPRLVIYSTEGFSQLMGTSQ